MKTDTKNQKCKYGKNESFHRSSDYQIYFFSSMQWERLLPEAYPIQFDLVVTVQAHNQIMNA